MSFGNEDSWTACSVPSAFLAVVQQQFRSTQQATARIVSRSGRRAMTSKGLELTSAALVSCTGGTLGNVCPSSFANGVGSVTCSSSTCIVSSLAFSVRRPSLTRCSPFSLPAQVASASHPILQAASASSTTSTIGEFYFELLDVVSMAHLAPSQWCHRQRVQLQQRRIGLRARKVRPSQLQQRLCPLWCRLQGAQLQHRHQQLRQHRHSLLCDGRRLLGIVRFGILQDQHLRLWVHPLQQCLYSYSHNVRRQELVRLASALIRICACHQELTSPRSFFRLQRSRWTSMRVKLQQWCWINLRRRRLPA